MIRPVTKSMIADVMKRAGNHPDGQPIFLMGWLSNRVAPEAENILLRAMEHIASKPTTDDKH